MNARLYVLIGVLVAVPAWPQAPADALARPPAGARHYVIQSSSGPHGESWSWVTTDGVHHARESLKLAGEGYESDLRLVPGADGLPVELEVRGTTPRGDAAERFSVNEGRASWHSPLDEGARPDASGSFYLAYGGPLESFAWLAERVVASPGHSLPLLPGGTVTATKLRRVELQGQSAADHRTVEFWSLKGIGNAPRPVWMNTDGSFFGVVGALSWLPDAYVGEHQALEDAQTGSMSLETGQASLKLAQPRRGVTAFTHVRLFDAEKLRFLYDQTVIVQGASIAAVGRSTNVKIPEGALLFDGHGKTLLPGLWDSHLQIADDYTSFQELSMGVTSIRDPGNEDSRTIDRRQRADANELLMPNVYASSLIDGEGPLAAPQANVAISQEWATALVGQAYENDFGGVMFGASLNPAWLAAAAAEAHRLGMHVHGVALAGSRPLDALRDGYDELTPIGSLLMQVLPEGVLAQANGLARYEGPARYGKDANLDAPELTALLQAMAQKHAYLDPTLAAFENLLVREPGEASPAYLPFAGTLPPIAERAFRAGGLAVPAGLTRADYRASFAKLQALLGKAHKLGIPVVAGSGGNGLELVHELELMVQAGFTTAEALATATIVPATLVGQGAVTGSISVGKDADLFLVEGDPERNLAALRQTGIVMLGGRRMEADALRKAAGFSDRPH